MRMMKALALLSFALAASAWCARFGDAAMPPPLERMRNAITDEQRKASAALRKSSLGKMGAQDYGGATLNNGQLATVCPPAAPGGTPDYFNCGNFANSPLPEVVGGVLTGGMRKFVDTLPGVGPQNANNLGQYIPIATADQGTYPGSDYYQIGLVDYTQQMHSDIPPTKLRGYKDLAGGDGKAHYLGPLIIAQRDRPVRIKFTNQLGANAAGSLHLPVDKTVMGAGMGPDGMNEFTTNRATIHLHGGDNPWISDGTPHQWITPAGENTPYQRGVSVQNVPDMPDPGPGASTWYWPNQQSNRLMFYHDHSWGITRLNVYAGEAAGYLLTDPVEEGLIDSGVLPNLGGVYRYGVPLIIQDKTFVPTPKQLANQDPTWDSAKWGGFGNLWFPHVYMPNQNPVMEDGMNPFGRWHYGPWFWPPVMPTHGPNPDGTPGVPVPSITVESWLDTPVINGTAYPVLQVARRAYRFRILNASNDRMFNLSLHYVDPEHPTEVRMVPFKKSLAVPSHYPPADSREGGIPDPTLLGPEMIQIGTEGGLLPEAVSIPSTPVGFDRDPMSMTVLGIKEKGVFLGCAERADVIVDFSQVPEGAKLILYNDAPAAVPAGDYRNDYYTGAVDRSDWGGAPSTQEGYGPNTRTLMMFVAAGPAAAPFNKAALEAALPAAFAASQPPLIVPEGQYVRLHDQFISVSTAVGSAPVSLWMEQKNISEEIEPEYGRMYATLGLNHNIANFNQENMIMMGVNDPQTEIVKDGETQVWKITHNGVDTHPIHFHLWNVQLINRVDWAGTIKPPDPNERGWKETVRMNPLEDVIVALRPKLATVPFELPRSVRPLNPAEPIGSRMGFKNMDWQSMPIVVENRLTDFGYEYTWHCHILGHEENDMMRPVAIEIMPTTATITGVSLGPTWAQINFDEPLMGGATWMNYTVTANPGNIIATRGAAMQAITDQSASSITVHGLTTGIPYTFTLAAANRVGQTVTPAFGPATPTAVPDPPFNVVATAADGAAVVRFDAPADNGSPILSYTVTSGPDVRTAAGAGSPITVPGLENGLAYYFTVTAANANGESAASAQSNTVIPTAGPLPPTNLRVATAANNYAVLRWTDAAVNEQGYTVEWSADGGATWNPAGTTGANASYFRLNGLGSRTKYLARVQSFNANGASAFTSAVTVVTR
ncbi:MAG: fibronectin type III domain-containing protein [Elusimicrobia bacterium]|nr:fibronectin type III domain-containing protein [Elusimicrobiota bacterium]